MVRATHPLVLLPALPLTLMTCRPAATATPGSVTFQGDSQRDDDLAVFVFTLAAPGDIAAATRSHDGGGFAPLLSLSGASGDLVQQGSLNHCANPADSFCWDAALSLPGAPAGPCTLVLSQDGNALLGLLADGFSQAGEPNCTAIKLGQPLESTCSNTATRCRWRSAIRRRCASCRPAARRSCASAWRFRARNELPGAGATRDDLVPAQRSAGLGDHRCSSASCARASSATARSRPPRTAWSGRTRPASSPTPERPPVRRVPTQPRHGRAGRR